MDEETLNMSIRKFLKRVGVTSQREIELAARAARSDGRLDGRSSVAASVRLSVPDLGLDVTIDDDLTIA